MGAGEPVLERGNEDGDDQHKEKGENKETHKDLEKGEMGFEEHHQKQQQPPKDMHMSRMQRLSATNPLRLVIDNATRVPPTPIPNRGPTTTATRHPPPQQQPPPTTATHHPSPPPPSAANTRSIPSPIPIPTPNSTPTPQFQILGFVYYVNLSCGYSSNFNLVVIRQQSLTFFNPVKIGLLWTAEVMRNVANLTISRVIGLYYLRGMQSNTQFCFQRAMSKNLGSACLGSLFVPTIEALRIVARGLNLLEGEDEFMFSCAHCCLRVMETIFRYGNGWAYVQIATYGKGFVKASQDTWELFEKRDMETIVDSDITTAVCFLTGVCSGSICVIVVAAWTAAVHEGFTATISLLAFIVGYLMTRIAMALPHACVSCYYVCYAENPDNRLFDKTIPDRLALIKSNRDVVVLTPRVPPRFRR
ncbi:hypothetical protein OSB04_012871 [Centaurea solstitialis]|uniref:Choline transporter-like protein n=1 Tax=Centaurea solstitialis TaxID=347529 RepID=A0AA38WEZ8_9ASTR|nr:hypothetical protein OSB04_012871 [Centaurea solstitialis]